VKVERACLHRANSRRDIALFADENHGWIAIFNDPPLQVQAVKSRRPMFKITQAAKSVPSGLRYSAAEAHDIAACNEVCGDIRSYLRIGVDDVDRIEFVV
jgi:hypothetical protein